MDMRTFAHLLLLALPILAGCAGDAVDEGAPLPTASIQATPPAIRSREAVTFSITTGEAPVDSLLLDFGDNQRVRFDCGGRTGTSWRITHAYNWRWTAMVVVKAYAGGRFTTTTLAVPVSADDPPIVRSLSIDINEGDSLCLPLYDLIHDPEGDPFTYSLAISDPGVIIERHLDTLVVKGRDDDFNGQARLDVHYAWKSADSVQHAEVQQIRIAIQPRDQITGTVRDIFDGTEAGTTDPRLILGPPFTAGTVIIDGQAVSVDLATGRFASPKLKTWVQHTVEWRGFTNASGESSFKQRMTVEYGDRELALVFHSNAGTGMSCADLREFFYQANFRFGRAGSSRLNGLVSPDTGHAQDYLAAQDLDVESHAMRGLTSAQQDLVAGWVAREIDARVPAGSRVPLVRGSGSEPLPVVTENGSLFPAHGVAVAFVERTTGSIPVTMVFLKNHAIERAWIRLREDPGQGEEGLSRGWTLGAFLARRVAPAGVVTDPKFAGRSCLAGGGSGPADHLTGADVKLLWLPILHPPGTSLDSWWKVD